MAVKKVTQKGREKRVVKPPAKRVAQVKGAAKAARSNRQTRAPARKPKRAAAADKQAPSADVELEAAVFAGCSSISTSGKTCRTSSS